MNTTEQILLARQISLKWKSQKKKNQQIINIKTAQETKNNVIKYKSSFCLKGG
jgi:hypothetical protein